jgi:hypothetical protein
VRATLAVSGGMGSIGIGRSIVHLQASVCIHDDADASYQCFQDFARNIDFGDIRSVGILERESWRHGGASGTMRDVEETALSQDHRRDLTCDGGGAWHQPPEFHQLGLRTGHGSLLACPKGSLARQSDLYPHRLGLCEGLLSVVPRVHGIVASLVHERGRPDGIGPRGGVNRGACALPAWE